MRNAPVQPRQRRAFERPADGDPLVIELQRDRDGDEARAPRRRRAPAGRCRARPRCSSRSRLRSRAPSTAPSDDRHDADHPLQAAGLEGVAAGEEEHRRRAERRPGTDRGRSRSRGPSDQRIGDEDRVERAGQHQQLAATRSASWPNCHCAHRQPRRPPPRRSPTHRQRACAGQRQQDARRSTTWIGERRPARRAPRRPSASPTISAASSPTNSAAAAPRLAIVEPACARADRDPRQRVRTTTAAASNAGQAPAARRRRQRRDDQPAAAPTPGGVQRRRARDHATRRWSRAS